MVNAGFWAVAGLLALGTAAAIVLALPGRRRRPEAAADADLQIYRDQLHEIGNDLARGTIDAAEGKRLKTEVARRLLEADRMATALPRTTQKPAGIALPALAVLAAAALALAVYAREGAPGYPDMPLRARLAEADSRMQTRPHQADHVATLAPLPPPPTDPRFDELMEKLRAAVDPATATDLRGLELLARNEAGLGNYPAALAARNRLIAVRGAQAGAGDYAALAETLIMQAQGYVSPEAEAALAEALRRDPKNGLALYYSGLMFAQNGRFDRAFALWRPLLEQGPQDAPWVETLREQIGPVAELAGIRYSPPPPAGATLPGPGAAEMEAAAAMTPEERQQMIAGMVDQLATRLADEGGSAGEWARLIRAQATLGRREEAQRSLDESRRIFAGSEADLALIAAAANEAGLAP